MSELTAVEVDRAIHTALNAIALKGKMPFSVAWRLNNAIKELHHAGALAFQWREEEKKQVQPIAQEQASDGEGT